MIHPTRRAIITAASSAALVAATSRVAFAQRQSDGASAPFHLDPLPYAPDALDPFIDTQTMGLHHDKHHAAYVNNLNIAAKESPQFSKMPVEVVLAQLSSVPESVRTVVRNNLGGHVNHTMFWQIMGPNGGKPEGELLAAIARDFGGLDKLETAFNAAGGKVFGSGWVFVTVTRDGMLAIETRPNQDTPLMDGKRALLGNDVWEHAYYLKYQNRRADYLKAWWNTVNWASISDRYARAKLGTLVI
jgi:Fe-Mn family superoxide dismutase